MKQSCASAPTKRGPRYYFRRAIPAEFRPAFNGAAEFTFSLKTKDKDKDKDKDKRKRSAEAPENRSAA